MSLHLKSFRADTRGNVIIIAAFMLPIILLVVGGAVDFSNNSSLDARLQEVADSAALAGMAPDELTDEERKIEAERFLNAAFEQPTWEALPQRPAAKVFATSDEVSVELETTTKAVFSFLGRADIPVIITSKAIPNIRRVPAAVDVIVGMDGGCGNEDQFRKLESQSRSITNLMTGLRNHQNGRQLVYAAGIWSGANMGGDNSAYDVGYISESLEGVAARAGSRGYKSAAGGTSMPNVLNEMFSVRNGYYTDSRPQKLQDKKLRIAVIFEGSHHEYDALETNTNNMCHGYTQSQFDGVYVFLVDGLQHNTTPCARGKKNDPERDWFPTQPNRAATLAYNIQYCQKSGPGMTFPALMRAGTSNIQNTIDPLAEQIANLKVDVRSGARITE